MMKIDLLHEIVAGLRTGRVISWSHESVPHYLDLFSNRIVRASAPLDKDVSETGQLRQPSFPSDVLFGIVPSISAWTNISCSQIPIFFHAGMLIVGPRLVAEPASNGCAICVIIRLLAASSHHHALAALWQSGEPVLGSWAADQLHSRSPVIEEALTIVASQPNTGIAIGLDDGRMRALRFATLPGHPEHRLSTHAQEIGLTD